MENVHIVLIEWDGEQPPTKYYRRLHGLALRVRGDKEQSPLARRSPGDDRGIIFQEGAVICPSASLARTVAFIARDEGAANVSIGSAHLDNNFTRSRQDAEILNRIEEVMGKRGRKPEPIAWAVSCTECMTVNNVEAWAAVNCPNCGGLLVHSRKGQVVAYADPGGDLLESWVATRFQGANWEPAPIDPAGIVPSANPEIFNAREKQSVEAIASSPLYAQLQQLPRDSAFAFLDAIMVSRAYRGRDERLQTRVQIATEFLRRGGNFMHISLTEPDAPDLIDAAALGVDVVVTWLKQFSEQS